MAQKFLLLLALFLIASSMSTAAGAAENDNNHLAVQLNVAEPDSARRVDGNGLGATFIYGFPIRENLFLEARVTGLILERGEEGGTDFYQQDLGVDAVYRFRSGERDGWQPFALLGVSAIRNDVDIDEDDGVTAGIHAGGGIVSGPLGNIGMKVRADVRYVHDEFLEGVQDVRLGIGVEIPLGADGKRAVPDSGKRYGDSNEDKDEDGILDYVDRCLNSLPYVRHDENGCMEPNQTIRLYEVTFNNGTSILTPAAREELGAIVRALRGQPDMPVQINGHTDAWGSSEENRRLSLDRAEAVATHLALQGIPTQRLSVKGYGESQPVDTNSTDAGRERNRRIEVVLLAPPSH